MAINRCYSLGKRERTLANNSENEQLLYDFFYELEKEFLDGVERGNHRWRQERYELWKAMGQRGLVRQMEQWFKGEHAVFLDTLKKERHMIVEWGDLATRWVTPVCSILCKKKWIFTLKTE